MTASILAASAGLAGCVSTQPRQEVYANGKLKSAYAAIVEDGQEFPQGEYKCYYDTGELHARGNMDRGVRTGPWTLYTKEGDAFTATFENDARTTSWMLRAADGSAREVNIEDTGLDENTLAALVQAGGLVKTTEAAPVQPVPVEVVKDHHDNGALKAEYEVTKGADGQPIANGKYVSYYANGNKQSEGVMKDGNRDGFWTLWYESGKLRQEGTYVDRMLQGPAKLYREDGSFFAANFKNAKPEGTWTLHLPDGTRAAVANYVNGVLEGEQMTYFPGGETIAEKIVIANGKKNGPFETFWPNGKTRAKGLYKDDQMEGIIQSFHDNGNRNVLVRFMNGKEAGRSYEFNPDGSAKRSVGYMGTLPEGFVDAELLTMVFGPDESKWPKAPGIGSGPGNQPIAPDGGADDPASEPVPPPAPMPEPK